MTFLTGWFGYDDHLGNTSGVLLDDVVAWAIHNELSSPYITLLLRNGHSVEIIHANDVKTLDHILNRIEYVSLEEMWTHEADA